MLRKSGPAKLPYYYLFAIEISYLPASRAAAILKQKHHARGQINLKMTDKAQYGPFLQISESIFTA